MEIRLDGNRILDRTSLSLYMEEVFGVRITNLDWLYDHLTDVNEDIVIKIDQENLKIICKSDFAFKVLMVLGNSAENNEKILIKFI